jgi:hypothetical protein
MFAHPTDYGFFENTLGLDGGKKKLRGRTLHQEPT